MFTEIQTTALLERQHNQCLRGSRGATSEGPFLPRAARRWGQSLCTGGVCNLVDKMEPVVRGDATMAHGIYSINVYGINTRWEEQNLWIRREEQRTLWAKVFREISEKLGLEVCSEGGIEFWEYLVCVVIWNAFLSSWLSQFPSILEQWISSFLSVFPLFLPTPIHGVPVPCAGCQR